MPNKLVYVGFAFSHHQGGHSGYHQIANYLHYDYYIDTQNFYNRSEGINQSKIERGIRHFLLSHFWFGFNAFPFYLIKCIWMALTKGHLTFHFIYGENLFFNSKLLRVRGCKTIVTLHQPYQWFIDRPSWTNRLKSVDQIILVGEKELTLFKQLTGKDNVTFIPHGVCNDFYCPIPSLPKEKMVLTVGNWLRDFEFANQVFQTLLKDDEDLKIVIVSNPKNKRFISYHKRIMFLSGISDEELRDLYRQTSCLFVPLIRFTANNAMLEAGAVGCPILIACNDPDNSYFPENLIKIVPMQLQAVVGEIKEMINNPIHNVALSDFVRTCYGWEHIADRTNNLIRSVFQENETQY